MPPMPSGPHPAALIPLLGRFHRQFGEWAWPLVRVAAGLPLIPHGCHRLAELFGIDLGSSGGFLEGVDSSFGPFWSYSVAMLQIVMGVLVIIGLGTRVAAALIAGLMLVSVAAHWHAGFYWTGIGFEYPLVLLLLALAVVLRGGGKRSMDRRLGVEL